MYKMVEVLHLGILLLGFIIPILIIVKVNKKHNYTNNLRLIKAIIIQLIMFISSAKFFQLILDKVYEDVDIAQVFNFKYIISFATSGYTFFGGYVGGLLAVLIIKKKLGMNKEICFWLVNNLNLMYAIMKIACFIGGCCYGFTVIPIQLLESIISLIIYVAIIAFYKKSKKVNISIGLSIILFSLERFILSFYRAYMTDFAFCGTEVMCIILVIIGSIICFMRLEERS